ncbi:MAG: tetratricopeptide repeat protein [Bacteroidales bacterium]|nr:tetratricopeptide repeat protein [Bacteroidales bacterium]
MIYIIKKYSRVSFISLMFVIICFSSFSQNTKTLTDEVKKDIKNYKKLIIQYQNSGNISLVSQYSNKIAFIYWENNYYTEAINYFIKSAEINKKKENYRGLKLINDNIGMIYSDMNDYENALIYFKKSLKIAKNKQSKKQIVHAINNVAITLNYLKKNNEAINILLEALNISKELNDIYLLRTCYGNLAENYEKIGNSEKSFENFNYYNTFNKQIIKIELATKEEENKKSLEQMKNRTDKAESLVKEKDIELIDKSSKLKIAKDSLEKAEIISKEKQMQIDLLNKDKKLKELVIKEKEAKLRLNTLIRNFILLGFLLVLAFSFLLFKQFKQIKKVNKLLKKVNIELKIKNIQILDSISYARRIQDAILPYERSIKEKIPDSFILFKPRDIVSGDFYWYSEQNGKLFIAAVDCTGHGVPGAFMSMIGNTLLNEIVNEKKITKPSEILKKLNEGIVFIMNQSEKREDIQDDGMEVTMCCIDNIKKEIQIASANQNSIIIENNEFKIINGDIYTIGGIFSLKSNMNFNNHVFKINKGTTVYLFSDGLQDQFGGNNNKKFMIGRLKKLIIDIQKYNMSQQFEIINNSFNEWKGKGKQIDDVLLIGIRFS